MSIQILHKGMSDSIQDMGRYGFQHLGIQPNGCMDIFSALLANTILQNDIKAPVIELHFPSSEIKFLVETIICITGGNFIPIINEKSVELNTPILVQKNEVLSMLQPMKGKITYIAIKSNYKEEMWLNSNAYNGKRFEKDQIIPYATQLNNPSEMFTTLHSMLNPTLLKKVQDFVFMDAPIRILPGPAWQDLANHSITQLLNEPFSISSQSNRMGFQLVGPSLALNIANHYLSSAVTRGTLQLLPSGEIIVLMADHQTIGGYANLGQIILVDLPRFAQMKTGQPFKFVLTNLETAQTLYREMYASFKY